MSVVTPLPARSGRTAELILAMVALGVGALAYLLVSTGVNGPGLPGKFVPIMALGLVTVVAAHLAIRRFAPFADPVLFPSAIALNALGLAMIHRIDLGTDAGHASGQLLLTFVAIALMVVTIAVIRNHRVLRRFTWTSLIGGIALLLLPMVPGLGREVYGARIWIRLAGFSFQPAELAKICFAIFFAGYLVNERDNLSLAGRKIFGIRLPKARHFVPIMVAWAACMGVLIVEKDFGTALLFFSLFVGMLYVATERLSWIAIGGVLAAVGGFAAVKVMPHIQARFAIWLHALDNEVYNAKYGSYQLVQGMFGMASGGLFGTGFGQGYPTKVFAADSDFIIASFGEEIGLVGLLAILSVYLVLIIRGMRTAVFLRDGFGKLLATGLAFTVGVQCFIVVGGVTRLIPLTGLAMPFLAHGGSALLTNWIIIGLLLRISDAASRPVEADPISTDELLAILPDIDDAEPVTPEPSSRDSQPTQVVSL